MTSNGLSLLAAAAGVAVGHAILPDHWVPLAVLGRTRSYPLSRVARISGLAGVAHVAVSLVLGGILIAIGLQFRSTVQSAQDAIVGGILVATGLGFGLLEFTGRGHHHDHDHHDHDHHDHDHHHDHGNHSHTHGTSRGESRGLATMIVTFGAVASPDLTILPVFLAATTAGAAAAVGSLIVFAAVTIGTIVGLTVAAARGGYEVRGLWLERWGNVLTAAVLLVLGALILTGTV